MKLRATTSAPIMIAERTPPMLSTALSGLVDVGRHVRQAMYSASNASGMVTRKTEPHAKYSSRKPERSGPSIATPPPRADHIAMDRVRAGPDQSAVMSASVVG